MLSVTRLLIGESTPGDDLRYGERHPGAAKPRPVHSRPIVVWNITRTCNLHCAHCYSSSHDKEYPGELSTAQAFGVLDDMADFKIPVVLFSGGEPTMRQDLDQLIRYASARGLKSLISTNGTLLTKEKVAELADAGLNRAGISLDGMEAVHDKFRGSKGAFQKTLSGIRNSLAADMRISVRITLTKRNVDDLPALFDLAERDGIPRVCVYHLAYAGRGEKLLPLDLDPDARRRAVEYVFERTQESHRKGTNLEVLMVDNHADAAYLQMWATENAPARADAIAALLSKNGGNSAGRGIAAIDNVGNVHPDQFWWTQTLGNVKKRPFSEIWTDPENTFLNQLRDRKPLLSEPCTSCKWLGICNGNLRVRAESATGDPWGHDPACYLTPEERTEGVLAAVGTGAA